MRPHCLCLNKKKKTIHIVPPPVDSAKEAIHFGRPMDSAGADDVDAAGDACYRRGADGVQHDGAVGRHVAG